MLAASDTGKSNVDNITANNTQFFGTAEPNKIVELLVDGDRIGNTTADESGEWIFTVPEGSAFADG